MNITQGIEQLTVAIIPILLGIVCHELAHGYVAYKLGDPTAKNEGRLTINPIPHIDATGAIVFIFSSLFTPFALGWAKPVPVNPRYFTNIRKSMFLVALAGPMANILLAICFTFAFKLMLVYNAIIISESTTIFLYKMLYTGVFLNILLAVFNILPIPSFDGAKILSYFLPPHWAYTYETWERYSFIIVVVLLAFGLLGMVLSPAVRIITNMLFMLFGIH